MTCNIDNGQTGKIQESVPMEDPTSTTTNPSPETATPWTNGLAQSLAEQRRQIEEFLASRRERMDGVESDLSGGIAQAIDELIRSRSETKVVGDELKNREACLELDAKHIEQMRSELDAAHADWDESRRATEKQQSLLFGQMQKQQQEQQEQLRQLLEETAGRQASLDEAREAFHRELEERPQTDPDSVRELEELRVQCEELRRELKERPQAEADNSEELERLTVQRDAAVRDQEESERLLAEAENKLVLAADAGQGSDDSEYQKRYELSLEDIRELREKNQSLEEELSQAKSRPQSAPVDSPLTGGQLSWEAQKQQILASLENEYDENDPGDTEQRLQIEDVLKKTEHVVTQKDGEIQDLKQLLENQSENIGAVAVGAAAFGEILDNDQIIIEERESLKQLKEEMRKKLSTAEIEISVERAKMARQRVELDEKLRQLSQQQPNGTSHEKGKSDDQEKPVRGRWLSRLGLNDIE